MSEPTVTLDLAKSLGLSEEEYEKILAFLGRTPTYTELGVYSVMWSEHCSYKNSIAVLKTLPRAGGRLLAQAGEENAGLVDIGDGLAVAFKIESHNHPSAVEPYQGAATGVGGILRDIFTMGARPIAALNSLRFGNPDNTRTRYLVRGVVKGIGDYANSFGVPTVAGEAYFEDCYRENPLVNAMAVGIVEHDKVVRAIAKGEGNSILIVGSSTGRDGIHGATFASEELSEASESRRPSVQVGDPFTEKLLLEASREAIDTGHVIGMQDMGAAGISCSTSEMSARGGFGMAIDLSRVPLRETDMTPYEIMLSESQERMLMVVERGFEDAIIQIFQKWDVPARHIGEVTQGDRLHVYMDGKKVVDVPASSLVLGGGAPVYHREAQKPRYLNELQSLNLDEIPVPGDLGACLLELLSSPSIASKNWIYQQYDNSVRTNTIVTAQGDAAVVRIKGTERALALKTDGNSRYTYLNPRTGGQIAVAEAARNVVCVGAEPIAITNCLNFGNPYDPEVFWQFREAVGGIADACKALSTPVTGGNVSFYNESPSGAIFPTPVIGMLGLIEKLQHLTTMGFKEHGDVIVLLGVNRGHLGGSEYLKRCHALIRGDAPPIELEYELALQQACLEMIRGGLIQSSHDVSDGGLAVALSESLLCSSIACGIEVRLKEALRPDALLFGEDQSRVVLSLRPENLSPAEAIANAHGVHMTPLGIVTKKPVLVIKDLIEISFDRLHDAYFRTLALRLEGG